MLSISNSKPRAHPAALSLTSPRRTSGFVLPSPRPMPSPSPRATESRAGEGLDQWFADFQKFEDTLATMALASEEPKFKEELSTIEQWFRLLSESEQTATMYTLLQTLNHGQIKFLMAVLQQMFDAVAADISARPSSRNSRPPNLNLATPTTAHINPTLPATPAPQAQEILVKPSEERTSWANMVSTPLDLMFTKGSDNKPTTPNMQTLMNASALNMSTSMLANMGFSNETQMMAIQLVMSGLVKPPMPLQDAQNQNQPEETVAHVKQSTKGHRTHTPAGTSSNWRNGSRYPSSALRSGKGSTPRNAVPKSAGLKSAGLKSSGLQSASSIGSGTTPKEEDVDPKLLEDIPAWLKSLRLHKYTSCFDNMTWREMVELDEPTMEKMGVVALGARRRLTKTFDVVKLKMGIPSNTVPSSATVQPSSPHSASLPVVPHSAAP